MLMLLSDTRAFVVPLSAFLAMSCALSYPWGGESADADRAADADGDSDGDGDSNCTPGCAGGACSPGQ